LGISESGCDSENSKFKNPVNPDSDNDDTPVKNGARPEKRTVLIGDFFEGKFHRFGDFNPPNNFQLAAIFL
jgi:hypothetical protein